MNIVQPIMLKLALFLTICITSMCSGQKTDALSIDDLPLIVGDNNPVRVLVCEIAKDPAAFNQKLIEVTGFVSRGFEDSSLFDPACSTRFGIWVEIGGTTRTGTMYCCGETTERTRAKELVVEQISIPLVDDKQFQQFDKLLQKVPDSIAHATLIGRFFSGKKEKLPGGEFWIGYGHMGMSSLFVIQQVKSVDTHDREGLDYGASVDQPDTDTENCGSYTILRDENAESDIDAQRKADEVKLSRVFDNPKQVATEGLAKLLKNRTESAIKLTETRKSSGRIVYHWRPHGKNGIRYMAVVSRPYWLSFYSKDP
ncbi:MAG TPA: hypothetical protein VK612_07395, partial [Pyrinomonadaceae bacterium]|nr:hypothetical protein [Pyrinomonadaceae bacterium]